MADVTPQTDIQAIVQQQVSAALKLRGVDDPLIGRELGWLHRVTASLVRRDGKILEKALRRIFIGIPEATLIPVETIAISPAADQLAQKADHAFSAATELPYEPNKGRPISPDFAILWTLPNDAERPGYHLELIEVKRGAGRLCARDLLAQRRDLLALQMQGRAWARYKGYNVDSVSAFAISVYGETGLPRDLTLTLDELDGHYGRDVGTQLKAAISYARAEVARQLPSLPSPSQAQRSDQGVVQGQPEAA